MNFRSRIQRALPRLRYGGWILLLPALAGCERNEIKSYRLTKESPAPAAAAMAPLPASGEPSVSAPAPAKPQLTWKLPAGWREIPPSEMRAASFVVAGTQGQVAEVAVIPMSGGGSETDLVNMWRQLMQLPPLSPEAAASQAETVSIGSDQGKLFDIQSEAMVIDGKARARILVATATRGSTSWFIKMTGEESFVREQKPVFVQFLKSVSFSDGAAPSQPLTMTEAHSIPAGNVDPGKPVWAIPQGWQELAPGQMLAAKYLVSTNNGIRTEVNIGTAMGGTLANVNRWRGQLGLPPVTEEAMNSGAAALEVEGGKAMVVDLDGTDARTSRPARILGVIVPQKGETWFYKMMGDTQVVEQQKPGFIKFVQTVKYPHAP